MNPPKSALSTKENDISAAIALPNDVKTAVANAINYIKSCQQSDGAILWEKGGKLDPWDHIESAMALTIVHEFQCTQNAFTWMVNNQNNDGSWYAKYYGDTLDNDNDRHKIDTNFVAYFATGLWHYYEVSNDINTVHQYFDAIKNGINFTLKYQQPEGDITWAISEIEALPTDALLTANSSILKSLECAIKLASLVKHPTPLWQDSYNSLLYTITTKSARFDRTWESKSRYSMDWFYPILAGAYTQIESNKRLQQRWQEFVEPELGCRCVSDQPWVTIAESCEWIMAMVAAGKLEEAKLFHRALIRWQDEDGGFWTGYNFKNNVIWPQEKTSWTAAAFVLATDALYHLTPASHLFTTPRPKYNPK